MPLWSSKAPLAKIYFQRLCQKPTRSINILSIIHKTQGPVSRKSRELFGPKKPFIKLRPAYSVELVFSYVVTGIKIIINAKFCASSSFVLKIKRELCHPIYAWKVSGLSRNRPQILYGFWFLIMLHPITTLILNGKLKIPEDLWYTTINVHKNKDLKKNLNTFAKIVIKILEDLSKIHKGSFNITEEMLKGPLKWKLLACFMLPWYT